MPESVKGKLAYRVFNNLTKPYCLRVYYAQVSRAIAMIGVNKVLVIRCRLAQDGCESFI